MNNKGILLYKNQNIKALLQAIRERDVVLKRDLQYLTGLSFATVSGLCNELVQKGVLEEVPAAEDARPGAGRIPTPVRIRRGAFFGVCVDLQNRGRAEITLMDICGERVFTTEYRYAGPADVEALVAGCHQAFLNKAWEQNLSQEMMIGVGVAIPGIFNLRSETVEECAIPEWDGMNLKKMFQRKFDLPVYVDNQTNLYVKQMLRGEENNAVYLHVGEGLGVGVVVEGRLLRGSRGYSSEISHLPFGDPALQCPRCGNFGCAETELSTSGFLNKYQRLSGNRVDWDGFVRAALAGEAAALQATGENAAILAKCVTTLLTLFDPDRMIIGRFIGALYPLMEGAVRKRVAHLGKNYRDIPIAVDPLGDEGLLKGSMEVLFDRWRP